MAESVQILLGGKRYSLSPSYGAHSRIEESLNVTLGQLWTMLASGALRVDEAAVIVTEGANASGQEFKPEDVAKLLHEGGFYEPESRAPIADFLAAMMWQPQTAKKKAEAFKVQFSPHTSESEPPEASAPPSPENTSAKSSRRRPARR